MSDFIVVNQEKAHKGKLNGKINGAILDHVTVAIVRHPRHFKTRIASLENKVNAVATRSSLKNGFQIPLLESSSFV